MSCRIRPTSWSPLGVIRTSTFRRSDSACMRATYPKFSRRSTNPLAAAVVWCIFSAISVMLKYSHAPTCPSKRYCGKETCPRDNSSESRNIRHRCKRKIISASCSMPAKSMRSTFGASERMMSGSGAVKLVNVVNNQFSRIVHMTISQSRRFKHEKKRTEGRIFHLHSDQV